MLGIKCFISSLFLWLAFSSPQDFSGVATTINCQTETISVSNNNHLESLIVDGHLETHQYNWSLKTFKTPFIPISIKVMLPIAKTYNYKLLYLEISKNIPLKLTSNKLIFPFHCFT